MPDFSADTDGAVSLPVSRIEAPARRVETLHGLQDGDAAVSRLRDRGIIPTVEQVRADVDRLRHSGEILAWKRW